MSKLYTAPMTADQDGVSILVHAESKVGKTFLGDTTPAPRLILDSEAGGVRFTPSKKIRWNPMTEPVPEADGTWETCVVRVRGLAEVQQARAVLETGNHPFRSVTLDSIMEMQGLAKRTINASGMLDMQGWGRLLTGMEELICGYRDLTDFDRPNHLDAVVFICGTRMRDGMFRPLLDGQITVRLPYKVDACGYLYAVKDDQGNLRRALHIGPGGIAVAGNRFGGRIPDVVWDPNIETLVSMAINNQGETNAGN